MHGTVAVPMKKITATRPFRPLANLLTPKCSVTIEGNNWRDGAVITEIGCYGATVELHPEVTSRDMYPYQVNTLAFLCLGFGWERMTEITGADKSQAVFWINSLKRSRSETTGDPRGEYIGSLVTSFVADNVIRITEKPETTPDVPIPVNRAIAALATRGRYDSLFQEPDINPRTLQQDIRDFGDAQGIPGGGPGGLVMFGYATGILPQQGSEAGSIALPGAEV